MAYDENGEWVDEETPPAGRQQDPSAPEGYTEPTQAQPANNSGGGNNSGGSSQPAPLSEDYFKQQLGDLYDKNTYQDYLSHNSEDPNGNWASRIIAKEDLRKDNKPNSTYVADGKGGYLVPPKSAPTSTLLGPATKSGTFSSSGGYRGGNGGYLGSAGGDGSAVSAPASSSKIDDVYGYLKGLFPGGGLNQDIINRRISSASDTLNAQAKQARANNEAYLADRGLIGSGPQATADDQLQSRLFGQLSSATNNAYANEEQNADARMISALTQATGLSEAEAANVVAQYNAQTGRQSVNNDYSLGQGNLALGNKNADNSYSLGLGNLALGNKNADNSLLLGKGNLALGNLNATNSYNLGAGNLQLNRDQLAQLISSGNTDAMLRYIELLMQGGQISSGGYL